MNAKLLAYASARNIPFLTAVVPSLALVWLEGAWDNAKRQQAESVTADYLKKADSCGAYDVKKARKLYLQAIAQATRTMCPYDQQMARQAFIVWKFCVAI